MSAVPPWVALAVIAFTICAIWRRYQPNMVLMLGGLALNGCALACGLPILPEGTPHGCGLLEPVQLLSLISTRQLVGVGFLTIVSGGFAAYMQATGASSIFVNLAGHLLRRIRNPYFILGAAFLLGNALCFVIPTAAGLAMLLIVTAYPLLVSLGCSPLSSAAVIASPMVIAYAPTSSMANLAAATVHMPPTQYLLQQQLPIAFPIVLAMCAAHIIYQKHCDLEKGKGENQPPFGDIPKIREKVPPSRHVYALLPLSPLFFTLLFNRYMDKWEATSVATAMFCAWIISFCVDLCLRHDPKKSFELSFAMFQGMGSILTNTVGLIFVAAFFAAGLQNCNILNAILDFVLRYELGLQGIGVLLSCIVGIITILTGSGVAAFSTLAHLVPELAQKIDLDSATTILMMNTASEMMRAASPIAGVVIIVAGYAGVSPFSVVKRTVAPCAVGFVTMLTVVALRLGMV